jgi:hypothetical protein
MNGIVAMVVEMSAIVILKDSQGYQQQQHHLAVSVPAQQVAVASNELSAQQILIQQLQQHKAQQQQQQQQQQQRYNTISTDDLSAWHVSIWDTDDDAIRESYRILANALEQIKSSTTIASLAGSSMAVVQQVAQPLNHMASVVCAGIKQLLQTLLQQCETAEQAGSTNEYQVVLTRALRACGQIEAVLFKTFAACLAPINKQV